MTDDVALDEENVSIPSEETSSDSQQEEMISKRRAEELVKKAKLKGRDSMQAENEALQAEIAELKNKQGSMGGMTVPLDPEALTQQIFDKFQQKMKSDSEQRAQEEMDKEARKVAETYHARMANGKESYEDFSEIMADFNPAAFPNLVYLSTQVENTPAVMYELMKNPSKLATAALLSERDPSAAQKMLNKISASIVANQQAKAEDVEVAPPLSRMSSSPTGQDSGKPSTVRDYKRMYRG